MKLSIITINFNNKDGLQKTIDSVIPQTYKDFEWIIIDGGSTDGSKELIEQYSQYITYWVSEPDKGIYNAMNKGIIRSKGEYLYFLNSGDALYSHNTLEKIFTNGPYGDILYGNVILVNKDNSQRAIIYNEDLPISYFIAGGVICHQATLIKRELFNNNLYNEDFKLVSDCEFEIKQKIKGKVFQYINQYFVLYDNTGLTSNISDLQKKESKQIINNIPWSIRKDIEELFTLRKKMENGYIKTIYYYSQKGELQRKIINIAIHILNFIERIENLLKKTYNMLKTLYIKSKIWIYQHIFCTTIFFIKKNSYKNIPIIINNFNRLTFLKRLIISLEKRGYKNIYIIDNNSTYEPLLEYYKKCPYTIFRLNKNVGYKAIWETDIYEKFKHSLYVYTDSDMEIDDSCPDDFLRHFINIMRKHPLCQKVGFGIRIDDLPNCFKNKQEVIQHESQYWINETHKNVYRAPIDTTFALYRPLCGGAAENIQETYRTGLPYVIRHLPWYIDSNKINQEELYYINTTTQSTHWTQKLKKESNIN